MNALEVVTFVVAVAAIVLAVFSLNRVLSQLGRAGTKLVRPRTGPAD